MAMPNTVFYYENLKPLVHIRISISNSEDSLALIYIINGSKIKNNYSYKK